jgi:hypothetical protein
LSSKVKVSDKNTFAFNDPTFSAIAT